MTNHLLNICNINGAELEAENEHLRQEYISPETARVLMEDNERLTAELASYKKAEPIFCGKCHKPMFANDKFCPNCGAREGEGK